MKTKLLANIFRWIARVIGSVLVVMALCVVIIDGAPNPFALPLDRVIAFFTLIMVLSGFVLAWRWEFLGGIISFLGLVLFVGAESVLFSDTLFFIALGVTSILFLASSLLRHYDAQKSA